MTHWLDPIWRRLASRVQPYILPRYSVEVRDSTLLSTEGNPAIVVEENATNIAIRSCDFTRGRFAPPGMYWDGDELKPAGNMPMSPR